MEVLWSPNSMVVQRFGDICAKTSIRGIESIHIFMLTLHLLQPATIPWANFHRIISKHATNIFARRILN